MPSSQHFNISLALLVIRVSRKKKYEMKILGNEGKMFASEVIKLIFPTGFGFRKQNLHVFCSLPCLLLPEVMNTLLHSYWKEGERGRRDVLARKKKMGNCSKILMHFNLYIILLFIYYIFILYIYYIHIQKQICKI